MTEADLVETTELVWALREPVSPYGAKAVGKRRGQEQQPCLNETVELPRRCAGGRTVVGRATAS